ncbi:MAG: glycosyltransferase family 4 protein [Nitrospirae bacterium]|nr:glycosyltransferase family 4 protein [Nitrospirota bacterium]
MNLILFFTYGVSLRMWDEKGLLDREVSLYQRLSKEGVKTTVITYGDEEDYAYRRKMPEIDIMPVYALTKKPATKICAFVHSLILPFILKDKIKGADIFKTNQMSGSWTAVIGKLLFGKKLIVRCGYEWFRFTQKLTPSLFRRWTVFAAEWLIYRAADRILLTSEGDRDFVSSRFKIPAGRISVSPNFIDTELFKPADSDVKKNRMLFIGRLTRQKNLFSLFDALKSSVWTLDMVGDGELKTTLAEYAERNNVKVNFLGRIANSRLPEVINQYPLFILPSYYEGNPKVLLEAMSCGRAVIGTNVEGIREIIDNKVNGILCETNAGSIKSAIEEVMHDNDLRGRLGIKARLFAEENCSIEATVKRELAVFKGLI